MSHRHEPVCKFALTSKQRSIAADSNAGFSPRAERLIPLAQSECDFDSHDRDKLTP
jgi:hypothetical protein